MGLSRHLDSVGIAHADADSETHARHVDQRRKMRGISWIPERVEDSPGASEFRLRADGLDLGQGSYWVGCGDAEAVTSGEGFQAHCNGINWARRWNFAEMTRNGEKCRVRRRRHASACEEFVVNLSPWQMKFINSELVRWEAAGVSPERRKEMLAAMADQLRRSIVGKFKGATGRDVVGSYLHFDSNKIHVGVIHSRVGSGNELVGDKRLGTVGPWSVAQNRIAKLGLVDPGDQRLRDNLDRFHSRFGATRPPLDIAMHDLLDDTFSGLVDAMGDDARRRFEESVEYYKAWKVKARREAAFRTPSSQAIAWRTLRIVCPLLPPQVQAALSVARTCMQALQVVSAAIDALARPPISSQPPQLQPAIR